MISDLRRYITLIEGSYNEDTPWDNWPDNEQPTVDYHIQGDEEGGILWIDMFSIPRKHQRKGVGEKLWRYFEESIPPKFSTIKLIASDAGDGPSEVFWRKMGFDVESRDSRNGVVMSKRNPVIS